MDPQKNDNEQVPLAAGSTAPTANEVNVDLAGHAPTSDSASLPSEQPVSDPVLEPADATTAADGSVSFTTDSNGNIQTVSNDPGTPGASAPGDVLTPTADATTSFTAPTESAGTTPVTQDSLPTEPQPAPPIPPAVVPSAGETPSSAVDPALGAYTPSVDVPPVVPVAAPRSSKKLLVILSAVAVVLLAAIVALFVM